VFDNASSAKTAQKSCLAAKKPNWESAIEGRSPTLQHQSFEPKSYEELSQIFEKLG